MPATSFASASSRAELRTTFPWWCQFGETPHPEPLPGQEWATLSVRPSLGLTTLESLLADGATVGPALVCQLHRWLHIPVEPQATDTFLGERLRVRGAASGLSLRRPALSTRRVPVLTSMAPPSRSNGCHRLRGSYRAAGCDAFVETAAPSRGCLTSTPVFAPPAPLRPEGGQAIRQAVIEECS